MKNISRNKAPNRGFVGMVSAEKQQVAAMCEMPWLDLVIQQLEGSANWCVR
jgi:hypothetical protein